MIEVTPTGEWPYELPPTLVISGGQGNDRNHTEVHLAIRRGNRHEVLGWYRLSDLVVAAHTAGAVSDTRPEVRRLVEPSGDAA